jgi:type VI secretion system secreted protein VgrG
MASASSPPRRATGSRSSAPRSSSRAKGTRSHLRTGHAFQVEDHPRDALNTRYLAIQIRHHGNQAAAATHFEDLVEIEHDEVYFAEVLAIPAATQFRAESTTPWPRIYGYENGIVDGPATSEYAQIDSHGRYAVKFKFDESSLKDGKASTFVRMMQPHGGGIEGFHFPLRKDTEVVFSFLGGDPDRPVISGVVPNALTPSPVTSGNHTMNVIQTGGRNRLELEDKSGQQRVTLSTPYSNTYVRMGSPNEDHELIVRTDDNTLLDAGKNYDQTVGQNGGGSWTATIKDNWVTHVQAGKHELWVDAATSLTDVKGNTRLHVVSGNNVVDVDAGSMTTTVKGDTATHVVSGKYQVDVDAGNTTIDTKAGTTDIKSKGKLTLHTDDQCAVEVGSNMTLKVGGNVAKEVKGSEELKTFGAFKKLYVSNNVNVTGGMKSDTFLGLSNSNAVGASIGTFLGAKVTLEASGAFSATYAYKLDISGGASLSFKYGLSMTVDNVIALTLKPTEVKSVSGPLLKRVGFQLASLSMYLASSGAYVIS